MCNINEGVLVVTTEHRPADARDPGSRRVLPHAATLPTAVRVLVGYTKHRGDRRRKEVRELMEGGGGGATACASHVVSSAIRQRPVTGGTSRFGGTIF